LRWPSSKVSALRPEDSTEVSSCIGLVARYNIRRVSRAFSMVWCGSLERACQPSRSPVIRPCLKVTRTVAK
ncbi:hypothetical protein AVEN_190707-1, partial [Araneus ventricosus]